MVKIGIDISLSSTAIYINNKEKQYIICYLNDNKTDKWANELNKIANVNIHRIEKVKILGNYSIDEIEKLKNYELLSERIIDDIKILCLDDFCDIRIEGYSYTKNTNSINDIICLSTLIRSKLLKNLNCNLTIISPNTLKIETCEYCYGVTEMKKISKKTNKEMKSEFKVMNYEGVPGGKFTKFEIYKSIIEKNVDNIILQFLIDNKSVMNMKKIPSPIDDINDALMLSKINIKDDFR